MRDPQLLVRFLATALFSLLVLALLSLLSVQMATHHLQGVAEGAIRKVFSDGAQNGKGLGDETVCRETESEPERVSPCDPTSVEAGRSFRSAACEPGGVLQLLGRRWRCTARFNDGSSLSVRVSLLPWRRQLELLLPLVEPAD